MRVYCMCVFSMRGIVSVPRTYGLSIKKKHVYSTCNSLLLPQKSNFVLFKNCVLSKVVVLSKINSTIHLIETTAARNDVALSYHKVRGLYVLAVVFAATVILASDTCSLVEEDPLELATHPPLPILTPTAPTPSNKYTSFLYTLYFSQK